jgi:hypothetical protein
MDTANKLFRFAMECDAMAKSAYGDDNKAAWREMAERWRQCAETSRNHIVAVTNGLEQKRQQPRSRAGRSFRPDQRNGHTPDGSPRTGWKRWIA